MVTTRGADPILQCEGLGVTFLRWGQKIPALVNLSLTVGAGEWIIIVGPNGSGKSTLLKCIGRRVFPTSGSLHLCGTSQEELSHAELCRRVFLVEQDPSFGSASDLSLRENLLLAVDDPSLLREEALAGLVKPFGLHARLSQLAVNLSGGERQLLAFLIAQLRNTPLLLLDEPLSSLDSSNARACLSLIEKLHQAGRTILQITHDLGLAATAGSRCIVIRGGEIVAEFRGKRSYGEIISFWEPTRTGV